MHRLPLLSIVLPLGIAALLGAARSGSAQTTVTAALPAAPATAVVAPAAPAPRLGFLAALGMKCKGCRARICNSPLGSLLKNAKGPLSTLTGGLVAPPGAHAAAHDPAAGPPPPPPPAVSAAAKIKQDQLAAKARSDAVRFLASVDCHWYPEAEAALIASLRADRSPCVRQEAAIALGSGCCCTKRTIEALRISAAGSNRDGNPGERSTCVRLAAYRALENCLCNCQCNPPAETAPYNARPETPEHPLRRSDGQPLTGDAQDGSLPAYYRQMAGRSSQDVIAGAQHTIALLQPSASPDEAAPGRQGNVTEIWVASDRRAPGPSGRIDGHLPSHGAIPRPLPEVGPPRREAAPATVELRRLPQEQPEPVYLGRRPASTWR